MNVPPANIVESLEKCWNGSGFDSVQDHHWAKNFGTTVEEIVELKDKVRADRTTRAAPNTQDDFGGEGK